MVYPGIVLIFRFSVEVSFIIVSNVLSRSALELFSRFFISFI